MTNLVSVLVIDIAFVFVGINLQRTNALSKLELWTVSRERLYMDIARRNLFRGKLFSHTEDVRLPWLKSLPLFYEHCTQCGECIDACPEKIIKKSAGGYPAVEFKNGECTFCGDCGSACDEHLFFLDNNKPAWDLVAVIGVDCLALKHVSCSSCRDSCAENAIKFTPRIGTPAVPSVLLEQCNGCGACVSPCPTFAINLKSSNPEKFLTENTV